MSLVRPFYPKRLTYSILWAIPTGGAIWGEVSQGHNDMLTAVGFEPDLNTNAQPTAPHTSRHEEHIKPKVFARFVALISFGKYFFIIHLNVCGHYQTHIFSRVNSMLLLQKHLSSCTLSF